MFRRGYTVIGTVVVIFVLLAVLGRVAHGYIDWLWFKSLSATGVFWTSLLSSWGVALISGGIAGLITLANLWPLRQEIETVKPRLVVVDFERGRPQRRFRSGWLLVAVAALVGWASGAIMGQSWLTVLQALHAAPFGGEPDPLFGKDASFYLFNLPLQNLIYTFLMVLLFVNAFLVVAVYAATAAGNLLQRLQVEAGHLRQHAAALLAIFCGLKAWGYLLASYQLVYSPRGVAFGASYTDVHAQLPGYRVLTVIVILLGLLALANMVRNWVKPMLQGLGFYVVASVVLVLALPGLMQSFIVKPSEISRETPYIKSNIAMTRVAYNLNKVTQQAYPAAGALTAQDVTGANPTIANVRLWDWKVLGQTYQQLQGLRSYYQFDEMDVDRYKVSGTTRQVMVAAREINYGKLPQQTWINQHVKYTHGYGVAASPTASVGTDGFPDFWVRDVPPNATLPELQVDRPEIYFGEQTDPYVIVDTSEQEFDYPKGDDNSYTRYAGRGGIPLGGLMGRLAFALDQSDYNVLFTGAITKDSQALIYRNIKERVQRIAPYLIYDTDPYIVVDGGKLFWIMDAYTVTDHFPYSEPSDANGTNYIRNAVKVVVGAYDGDIRFFANDTADPLLKTYANIFPGLYQPLEQMPAGLRAHLRYPEQLYSVQAKMYAKYHMTDPQVFYNSEDLWQPAQQAGTGATGPIAPYYAILQLPGETSPEYVLAEPFTPYKRANMVSVVVARTEGPHAGELVAYLFPKEKNVLGPQQVESNINSTPAISQSITLWNQQGSQVSLGTLFVIPIKNSVLYIQPMFLQGSSSPLPRLQRVIVAYGDQVAMAPTLEEALKGIFTGGGSAVGGTGTGGTIGGGTTGGTGTGGATTGGVGTGGTTTGGAVTGGTPAALAARASQLFSEAQSALKAGDFASYGQKIGELGNVLQQLQAATGGAPAAAATPTPGATPTPSKP